MLLVNRSIGGIRHQHGFVQGVLFEIKITGQFRPYGPECLKQLHCIHIWNLGLVEWMHRQFYDVFSLKTATKRMF
jgi:hypothetical protein